MLAKLAESLPADGNFLFEPKGDDFRAIVFRGASDVYRQSRDSKPLDRYFPCINRYSTRCPPAVSSSIDHVRSLAPCKEFRRATRRGFRVVAAPPANARVSASRILDSPGVRSIPAIAMRVSAATPIADERQCCRGRRRDRAPAPNAQLSGSMTNFLYAVRSASKSNHRCTLDKGGRSIGSAIQRHAPQPSAMSPIVKAPPARYSCVAR